MFQGKFLWYKGVIIYEIFLYWLLVIKFLKIKYMSKFKVCSGKGEFIFKKSKVLVGLCIVEEKIIEDQFFVKKEVYQNLGGFKIVSLNVEGQNIDQKLDVVCICDEVVVGIYVYYVEGSDKFFVVIGELFIIFEEGVDEEEQGIVLEEYKLEFVEWWD